MHKDGSAQDAMNVVHFQRELSVVEEAQVLSARFQRMSDRGSSSEQRQIFSTFAAACAKLSHKIGDEKTLNGVVTVVETLRRDNNAHAPAVRELTVLINTLKAA